MSAYLLVSLHTNPLHQAQRQPLIQRDTQAQVMALKLTQHPAWSQARWVETGAQQSALSD